MLTKSKTDPGEIKGEVFKKAAPESQNRAKKGGMKNKVGKIQDMFPMLYDRRQGKEAQFTQILKPNIKH